MKFSKAGCALLALGAGLAMSAPARAEFTLNAGDSPITTWTATNVGWLINVPTTTDLTDLYTTIGPGDNASNGPVTAVIYSDRPGNGGTQLSSGQTSYSIDGGTYDFAMSPVTLNAGSNYFVGFENVGGTGANVTLDPGAVNLGTLYYDYNGAPPSWDLTEVGDFTSSPILGFDESSVPEPAPVTVMLVGAILLAGSVLIRKRASRSMK